VADQLIRDELLDSDRWLDLPSDSDRLAYLVLRLKADDFGNLEAGEKRIGRLFLAKTQINSPQAVAATLSHLHDADLIRFYPDPEWGNGDTTNQSGPREFIHLPRSRPTKSYLVRKCPPSPWCDPDATLGKHVRGVKNQGLAKNLPVTSPERNGDVSLGVGVRGLKNEVRTPQPVDNFPKAKRSWAEHWKAQGKAFGINPNPGESEGDYCRRVQEFAKVPR